MIQSTIPAEAAALFSAMIFATFCLNSSWKFLSRFIKDSSLKLGLFITYLEIDGLLRSRAFFILCDLCNPFKHSKKV